MSVQSGSTTSGAPSPPSSGDTTPRLSIAPCPLRLQPLIPPPNYGTVDIHAVYRSSFPQDRNLRFLQALKIRSVLTLVDTEPSPGFEKWMHDNGIKRAKVSIATNKKEGVQTTTESLCEALLFILDAANHPVYVHCNQGKHRTGCVIACLRKVQKVPLAEIIAEYTAYAWPKVRTGDVELIQSFDPAEVYAYALRRGYLRDARFHLGRREVPEVRDVDQLVAVLAGGMLRQDSAVAGLMDEDDGMDVDRDDYEILPCSARKLMVEDSSNIYHS